MSPVLKNADVVLVKPDCVQCSSPKRGDVIVFKPKGNENSHYYTKKDCRTSGRDGTDCGESGLY